MLTYFPNKQFLVRYKKKKGGSTIMNELWFNSSQQHSYLQATAINNNFQIIREVCKLVEESFADISIKKMQRKIGWLVWVRINEHNGINWDSK